jgi:hypothetical protein
MFFKTILNIGENTYSYDAWGNLLNKSKITKPDRIFQLIQQTKSLYRLLNTLQLLHGGISYSGT